MLKKDFLDVQYNSYIILCNGEYYEQCLEVGPTDVVCGHDSEQGEQEH
jgi:hypothetical protein